MKKLTCFLIGTLLIQNLFAQDWPSLMQATNGNFYTVQKAFNDYWERNDKSQKGRGYGVFKRWEYHVAPRVYPSGDLSLLSDNANNFQRFLQNNPPANNGKQIGQGALIASSTWSLVGPIGAMTGSNTGGLPHKAGRINFITFHPTNPSNYWTGAPAGGLWQTTNNGSTWTTNTDFLTVIGCSDLAVDPTNTMVLYMATGDGDAGDTPSIGVLKSTNGGATWAVTGLTAIPSTNLLIRRLIINPTNPQIVLAATNGGIYRTTNGGTNWSVVSGINAYDLEFKPGDPNTVYASGAYFYLSTNGGASFVQITSGIATTGSNRMAIAVTTNSTGANYVYALASASSSSSLLGVYRSTNSGVTFSLMANTPNMLGNSCAGTSAGGQGWYDLAIAASPLNADEVVIGGVNHWRSMNGGVNWTNIGCWNSIGASPPFVHADVHELEYNANGVLYSANDGGVCEYNGTAWIDRTGNQNISQIYRIGISSLSPNLWITGHQDNGSNIYNGVTYSARYGGDGMDCFVDRTNNSNIFASSQNGGLVRSTNGGTSWFSANTGITGTPAWLCPWKQNPQNANFIYAGYNTIWSSSNLGVSWTSLAPITPTAGSIIEFAIAPTNSLVMYVLKSSGVFLTQNGGTSWTNITGIIPVGSGVPNYVVVDATDPNTAWVTLSGYSAANKVFMTTNAGANWTNVTANLPNLPANCIVYEPGTNDRIYVGMDVGVYYKDNSGPNWTLYNTGLPNTVIFDLEISPAAPGKIRAATYGRGVYEVDVVACAVNPTVSVINQTICPGGTATLSASGASVYAWSNGSSSASIVVSPSVNSVYTVTGSVGACSDTKTVSVTVTPAPSISITSNPVAICGGGSTTLTASGASSYTWNTGSNAVSIVVSPSINTSYTVVGSNGVCSSFALKTVSISSNPTITANNQTVCIGGTAILSPSGAITYTWNTGANTPTIAVSPSVNTVYTVSGSNAAGCSSTKTINVTIGGSLPVSISNLTLCAGSSGTITASGATNYTWNTGANGSGIVVNPSVTTNYSVVGSNGSCSGSASVTVVVNAVPVLTITSSAPGNIVCTGSNITFTASGACSYTWSGGITNAVPFSPITSGVYTVFASACINGCASSKTIAITVVPNPTVSVNNQTICAGGAATLIASGASTYSWSTGATSSLIVVSPTANVVYTVTGNSSGCSNTKTVSVTLGGNLSLSVNSLSLCAGSFGTLTASGAINYTWSTGANGSGIVVNPSITTTYSVIGSNGACTGNTLVTVSVTPTPTISASASPGGTVCSGTSVTVTPSGGCTYTISGAFGFVVTPTVSTTYTISGSCFGCIGSSTLSIPVQQPSTLNITASSSSICAGSSATLIASGSPTYSWSNGASGSVIVVSPSVTTSYSVIGSGGICNSSGTKLVTVVQPPVISVNNQTICSGSTATLIASGASGYNWSTGSTLASIVVSPSVSTIYTVTGNNAGCVNTKTASVTIGSSLSIFVTASPTAVCVGGSVFLLASGANSYTWSTGANSPSILVSPSVATTYSILGASGSCTGAAVKSISISPNPTLTVASSPSGTLCAGSSVTLIAAGAGTYSWSNGSSGASIVVTPTANSIYSVVGSNGACSVTQSISVAVGIGNLNLSVSANPPSICAGGSATLMASGANSYSWSNGATGSVIVVNPSITSTYSLTGSNGACTGNAATTISVSPAPALNVSVSPSQTLCLGKTATLTASGNYSTFTWTSPNISGPSIVVTPTASTLYTVYASGGQSGCNSNTVVSITLGSNPVSVITTTNPNCSNPCTGVINAASTGGAAPYSYSISSNTCTLLPCSNLCQGLYTLYTIDANGCSSFNIFSIACTGISTGLPSGSQNENETIFVYPNPAHDKLNIEFKGGKFNYVLYNSLGQLVSYGSPVQNTTSIDLTTFAKGIYLLQIHTGNNKTIKKIIVE